ncbi:MAG: hypothetical protein ACJA0N_001964 [Pseudohongiellaceae bacterium]|jgi:hypothetical protein
MKKRLYIHIGRPKVGSSALQQFLFENRVALKKRGVLYPEVAMHQNASHKLSLVFQPHNPDYRIVKGLKAKDLYRDLVIEAEKTGAKKIVVSSEHFFLTDPKLLPVDLLSEFDVKVICYVRRQDDVMISSYFQEVKMGVVDNGGDIYEYAANPLRLSLLDYKPVLDSWAKQFKRENIIVRVFEDIPSTSTIFEDFMGVIDEPVEGLKFPAHRINASPTRDIFEFIRKIDLYSNSNYRRWPLWASLRRVAEDLDNNESYDAKSIFPNAIRNKILQQFEQSNSDVAREYLGRESGKLFSVENISDTEIEYPGDTLERFVAISTGVFALQQRQIFQMQKRLDALEGKDADTSAESTPITLFSRVKRRLKHEWLKVRGF